MRGEKYDRVGVLFVEKEKRKVIIIFQKTLISFNNKSIYNYFNLIK